MYGCREGTILVTASVTGTVLRLFGVPSGEHLCSFRRGTRSAEITSFCFSPGSSVLAVGSSSGTVHIFDVRAGLNKRKQQGGTAVGEVAEGGGEGAAQGQVQEQEGSWGSTLTSSALTYLSKAQSWGKATVGGLNLLPAPLQEFTESMW